MLLRLAAGSRHLVFPVALTLLVLFVSAEVETAVGQDAVCQNCGYRWQSPVANPGGPYVALTAQNIALDGGASWSSDGWIIYYDWDFGDGTYGSGPNPNHQYNADGVYSVWLTVCDDSWNCASSQSFVTVDSVNVPVRLTFDELPNNTVVADQYLNQDGIRFYSGNPFYPVHTYQNCGFCQTTSPPNFISTKPDDAGQMIVEFTQPVSNLTFYMIGVDAFFNQFAILDVYRSGSSSPYATYPIYGNGTFTVGLTLGSLTDISKIVVRGITDPAGIGFDDFTFSVPSDIKITSARVSGYLNGTTQNALLGADIALNATPIPGGFAGGTYSWSFTGPYQTLTSTNSSSITIRSAGLSTDFGPITATVSYTKNGLTATGSVTINSVLPTVTSFTAQQANDRINPPGLCSQHFGPDGLLWWYEVGCPDAEPGMSFLAEIHAPTMFISDPSQSGVKFVQAVSIFQKRMEMGLRCNTRRTDESNIASGWQLDAHDPMSTELGAIWHFSVLGSLPFSGDSLSIAAHDSPGSAVTGFVDYQFREALYEDDRFETYVVYFTGDNPAQPLLQKPIGKLTWNWGGLVVFDSNGHHIRYTNAPPGQRTGQGTNSPMVTMQGNWLNNSDVPCPGDSGLSTNRIDSSRELVKYYYRDILGRNPDSVGWNNWTSNIAQCVFEWNCLRTARPGVALGFLWSGEFRQSIAQEDPVMAAGPGSSAEYNRRFVYWCYRKFLRRDPDQTGWDNWTNTLNANGDYGAVVFGFIYSSEYRNRPFD